MKRDFNITEQSGKKVLDIYLYGNIEGDSYGWWGEKITSTTSCEYVRKAIARAENPDEINVFINSFGGSVKEGTAIYNQLKRNKAYVTAYVDGFAYSVASIIAMAADKIIMPSNTSMFLHNAMWGVYGNSNDLRKSADDLDVLNEASHNSYLVKAGDKLTKERLTQLCDEETFLSAEQALELGLCDEVVDPVDMSESREVVEKVITDPKQKTDMNKKAVAKAIEVISSETPKKHDSSKELDGFEWLKEAFKNTKF